MKKVCLNPCSNGIDLISMRPSRQQLCLSLNPCSNGIDLIAAARAEIAKEVENVLILVLME